LQTARHHFNIYETMLHWRYIVVLALHRGDDTANSKPASAYYESRQPCNFSLAI